LKYFWLSTHLGYGCRHSGACCTARWPIPIERDRIGAVQAAIANGHVSSPGEWYRPVPDAPAEVAGVLALQASGACVFHRPPAAHQGTANTGGCAIHPIRPVSCRHFPYACVIDPRGVHVTLSHFCPTAASLLFDEEIAVRVVEGPPIFADGDELEGLDAREALPPVAASQQRPAPRTAPRTLHMAPGARPQLMSWDAVTEWEHAFVGRLAADADTPEPPSRETFDRARTAVSDGCSWPEAPADLRSTWDAVVAPAWPQWRHVIGRYLAAKAHASWVMHLGAGPHDVERQVDLARTVLQVEATRACTTSGQPLDRAALVTAIRQADLLLLHHADPFRLCLSPNS
jgi:Fe-S-cluster containining protein